MNSSYKMLAYCGLYCDHCPIHLATLEMDESVKKIMRDSISKQCKEKYGMDLKPEDITDCDGCTANTGRLFSGCRNCEIRKCAMERNHNSCGECPEYPCNKLSGIFHEDPGAKTRLDLIKNPDRM